MATHTYIKQTLVSFFFTFFSMHLSLNKITKKINMNNVEKMDYWCGGTVKMAVKIFKFQRVEVCEQIFVMPLR